MGNFLRKVASGAFSARFWCAFTPEGIFPSPTYEAAECENVKMTSKYTRAFDPFSLWSKSGEKSPGENRAENFWKGIARLFWEVFFEMVIELRGYHCLLMFASCAINIPRCCDNFFIVATSDFPLGIPERRHWKFRKL